MKLKLFSLFALTIFVAFAACEEEDLSQFVINGVDTSILDHPYMAGIHVHWRGERWWPFCGASIINRFSVLTGEI